MRHVKASIMQQQQLHENSLTGEELSVDAVKWIRLVEEIIHQQHLQNNEYVVLVFDLDETIWQFRGQGEYELYHQCGLLLQILYTFFRENIRMCIATYNLEAPEHLKRHSIMQYFDFISFGRTYQGLTGSLVRDGKVGMLFELAALLERYNFQLNETNVNADCHVNDNNKPSRNGGYATNVANKQNTGTCSLFAKHFVDMKVIQNTVSNMILFDDQPTNYNAVMCSSATTQLVNPQQGVTFDDVLEGLEKWAEKRTAGIVCSKE